MVASVHDNLLVSYEVRCEARVISLRTEYRAVQPPEVTEVVFTQVEGYHFEHDAFGTIISEILDVPLAAFVTEHQQELSGAFRVSGALGPWTSTVDSALSYLRGRGVRAFEVLSSIGMSGWVLARSLVIGGEAVLGSAP